MGSPHLVTGASRRDGRYVAAYSFEAALGRVGLGGASHRSYQLREESGRTRERDDLEAHGVLRLKATRLAVSLQKSDAADASSRPWSRARDQEATDPVEIARDCKCDFFRQQNEVVTRNAVNQRLPGFKAIHGTRPSKAELVLSLQRRRRR
jgi:hypothetical protein